MGWEILMCSTSSLERLRMAWVMASILASVLICGSARGVVTFSKLVWGLL